MKKIRRVVREMRDADVRFISLVDKGANQIPFKITKTHKENEDMLDLTNFRNRTRKAEEVAPVVSGVIVMAQKNEQDNERIKAAIAAAGFSVEKMEAQDDGKTFCFAQTENAFEDMQLVRMSDHLLLAVKGFQPQHPDMKDADFTSSASANSFYQGLDAALDTFYSKVCDVVGTAKSEVDASAATGKLADGLKDYITKMVKALPSAAFKLDAALGNIAESIETAAKVETQKADTNAATLTAMLEPTPKGFSDGDWSKMSPVDKMKWVLDTTNTPITAPAIAKADETPAPAEGAPKEEAKVETEKNDSAAVLAAITALQTSVDTRFNELTTKMAEVETTAKAAVAKAESVEKSTVTAPAGGGDNPGGAPAPARTQKREDGREGYFDTAFLPGSRRGR